MRRVCDTRASGSTFFFLRYSAQALVRKVDIEELSRGGHRTVWRQSGLLICPNFFFFLPLHRGSPMVSSAVRAERDSAGRNLRGVNAAGESLD